MVALACLCLRFAKLQRPQTRRGRSHDQTFPQAFPRQLSSNFRRPFQGNSRSYRPSVFKRIQDCHLPPSNRYRPQPSVFEGVQNCRLPALKPLKPSRKPFQGNSCSFPQAFAATCPRQCFKPFRKPFHSNSRSYRPQPSVFRAFKTGVCPSNPPASLSKATLAASRRHFQGNSCSYMPQTMLQTSASLSNATLRSYRPQPSVFKHVQDCRLPAFKPLQAPAICF